MCFLAAKALPWHRMLRAGKWGLVASTESLQSPPLEQGLTLLAIDCQKL